MDSTASGLAGEYRLPRSMPRSAARMGSADGVPAATPGEGHAQHNTPTCGCVSTRPKKPLSAAPHCPFSSCLATLFPACGPAVSSGRTDGAAAVVPTSPSASWLLSRADALRRSLISSFWAVAAAKLCKASSSSPCAAFAAVAATGDATPSVTAALFGLGLAKPSHGRGGAAPVVAGAGVSVVSAEGDSGGEGCGGGGGGGGVRGFGSVRGVGRLGSGGSRRLCRCAANSRSPWRRRTSECA